MKRLILATSIILSVSIGYGANLNIDASKKKNARILKPEAYQTKQNASFQNKRFKGEKLKSQPILYSDSQMTVASESPGKSVNQISGQMARANGVSVDSDPRILDQVVTSSEAFEKAFREALTIELSKRAAAQVEIKKAKAKPNQSDINKDAKVRRSKQEGFEVQRAGSDPD